MRLPGLSVLKDKWVLLGLAAGAGVYLFSQHHPHSHPMIRPHHGVPRHYRPIESPLHDYFPHYDTPGEYETGDFQHLRFSGQAQLQRRLTIS